jgi:polysaccharide biosynthesis/export protein
MLKRYRKKILVFGIMLAGLSVYAGNLAAENELSIQSLAPQRTVTKQAITSQDYVLKNGDKINIVIYPADEYVRGGQMQINSQGTITLSLLGQVEIAGLKIVEAQEKIAKLLNEDYLVDPSVVIEISQFKQQTFVILGQVKSPGTFQFPAGEERLSFLQAISIAGGFSEIANIKKIKIIRESEGKKKVIRINAERIISGKDSDVSLQPNDIIHVSESLF